MIATLNAVTMAHVAHAQAPAAQILEALARALAKEEGYFGQGKNGIETVPKRLDNPGSLRSWRDPSGEAYPVVNGFAQFPRCSRSQCKHGDHPSEVGWRALRAQCKINIVKRRLSLVEFLLGKPGVYNGFLGDRSQAQRYLASAQRAISSVLGETVKTDSPLVTYCILEVKMK